jgi:Domain of unknown function (DUF4272)
MADETRFPSVPEELLQGTVRTNLDSPAPTPAQLARRDRSISILKELGVPYLAGLPVTEDASSIKPRSAEEIARRCIAIAICAVKGETRKHDLGQKLIAEYGASQFLSAEERAFIDNPSPPQQQFIDFSWRYEAVHVLLWSMGYLTELHPPNEICDVPNEVGIIRDQGDALASRATVRTMEEILDQADLYYHLHWSAIELRLRGESADDLDEGIIRERHRALNWLIRYMGQDWDDVETDT